MRCAVHADLAEFGPVVLPCWSASRCSTDNALCTLIGHQPAADAETWRFTV